MSINEIIFIGSGDAFGSGGRLQSCFLINFKGKNVMLECGSTSMAGLNRCGIDCNDVGVIITSNLHGDHFGGIPYLLAHFHLNSRRAKPLVIAGPDGMKKKFIEIMDATFPGSSLIRFRFDLEIMEMSAGRIYTFDGITIRTCSAIHPEDDPHLVLRIESDYKVISYTGDTEWADEFLTVIKDADLFIAESYFFNKKVKFHLDYETLKLHFSEINAGKTIITHMSSDMLSHLGEIDCDYAEDGKVFSI